MKRISLHSSARMKAIAKSSSLTINAQSLLSQSVTHEECAQTTITTSEELSIITDTNYHLIFDHHLQYQLIPLSGRLLRNDDDQNYDNILYVGHSFLIDRCLNIYLIGI
jgi:hypothetical protein